MRMMILLNQDGGTIRGMNAFEFASWIRSTLDGSQSTLDGSQSDWPIRLVSGPQLPQALEDMTADPSIGGVIAGAEMEHYLP